MDIQAIKATIDQCILTGCCGGLAGIGLFALARWACRVPGRVRLLAKRLGWGTVAMLLGLAAWATYNGTPTQDDKDDYAEREQGESSTNSVLGAMLVPGGMWKSENEKLGHAEALTGGGGALASSDKELNPTAEEAKAPPLQCVPTLRPLTVEDYVAGLVLTQIDTDETHDFSPPEDATVCADWLAFGANRDWFGFPFRSVDTARIDGSAGDTWMRAASTLLGDVGSFSFLFGTNRIDALTVFSYGTVRPSMKDVGTFVSPLHANLGIVPQANWGVLSNLHSQFWQCLTASNTLVMTWQNVLLDRDVTRPISFQAEFFPNGDITFRYDLTNVKWRMENGEWVANDVLSNVVVGVMNGGVGRTFDALPTNVTSLHWAHLDPTRADEPDPDGDGLTTDDELFVYHTDPYSADTDKDGLSDGRELIETATDPLDPHSLDPRYPDGVALVLGDEDPFACPEGSTNTVWEHVFYTGTTNAPFAYPQSTDATAVLRVSVSGTGSGELIVGDAVVPLLAPPMAQGAARAKSRTAQNGGTSLLVSVVKGRNIPVILRGDGSLSVDLDSDDFAFGVLPSWEGRLVGFVNFPNTVAETPCIHDFNARRKRISLPVRDGAELLTCTWQSSDDVRIENRPPRSALVTADFSARTTRGITYTLNHPYYLFGATTYDQTVRFCPRPPDPDPDDPSDSDPSWYDEGEGVDETDGGYDERWCCYWGLCDDWCGCGCDCAGSSDEEEVDDEICPVHDMPYEDCASDHEDAYSQALQDAERIPGVLLIRDPLLYDTIDLPCPEGHRQCCPCPDHQTDHVSVAYRSRRLEVLDETGDEFSSAHHPCSVRVAGVRPSSAIGDASLSFETNGVVFRTYDYTVLGMEIVKPYGASLRTYEALSRTTGLPMTVNTNLDRAVQLTLRTNVRLPFGNVRLALEDSQGQFAVWIYDRRTYGYRKILDSDGRSILNVTLAQWRKLVGNSSDYVSSETPIYVTSSQKGSTTLRFGYWGVNGGRLVEDWDSLVVTSFNPLLLPDYNRDGVTDQRDVEAHLQGAVFVYWRNDDVLKGGCISSGGANGVPNAADAVVNGPLDLVNFFPVALDVKELIRNWGPGVTCAVETDDGDDAFRFCLADVAWNSAGSVQTSETQTLDGQNLSNADLQGFSGGRWIVPRQILTDFGTQSGLLVAEAVKPYVSFRVTFRLGDQELFSYALPMMIWRVREMYRFFNLRGAEEVPFGTFVLPNAGWPVSLPDTKDADVFFTHGFNVSLDDARLWGDVLFKRFWLSGSRARFNMVTWAGNYHLVTDHGNALHYQQDAYQAQMTGNALKRLIERTQPDPAKRVLMTQSLGNMVACEALREGLNVAKYFMFNAAVPSEAIDGSLQSTSDAGASFSSYVPPAWRSYPHLSWAANWFRWFVGDAEDARGSMGWPDRFASALDNAGEVYNYYSTGDEIFHNTASPPWLLEGMGESSANYSWQKQETLKGSSLPGGTLYGGWGFHSWSGDLNPDDYTLTTVRYSPEEAASMVAGATVTNTPVFNRGYAPMLSRDASQEEVFMALAKYVPAVSSAVGGRMTFESMIENHDLNEGTIYRDGWGREPVEGEIPWKHSDMKDNAYRYVYRLYLQLVEKGCLK